MRRSTRKALLGYVWISPWLIGFCAFTVGPMLASLILSLTSYKIVGTPKFVGLANYTRALSGADRLFWPSLGRTTYYTVATVTLGVTGSLGAALLLNQRVRGTTLWRTCFFLPSLTPLIAAALLWKWLLQPQVGLVNYLLGLVHIPGPPWLGSPDWAIPAMILISVWSSIGGSRMVIFLAGLQGVPEELYEASKLDGANRFQRFWHVTVPMISPTILFNLVIGLIGAFQVFGLAYIATEGGPAYATWFYALHLFTHAFRYFEMGYASTLAWIFFLILLVLSYLQIRYSERWVFYAGG